MADVRVEMNMAGLVEIANQVNDAVAEPIAQGIAARAGAGHSVRKTPRTSTAGWARTRVFTDTPEAMRAEVTSGNLSRALGGA